MEPGQQYPIGYPEIFIEPEIEEFLTKIDGLKQVFGFVKCQILAPRTLRIPSVPAKINDKLIFALCRSCAEEERRESCTHDETQRAFTVHIATPEVYSSDFSIMNLIRRNFSSIKP